MDGPISQHHTVRQSYDAVAEEYLERFRNELAGKPLDRALLACRAEEAEDVRRSPISGAALGMWQPGSPAVA